MAAERVSIGFSGGQVVEVRLSEGKLNEFRKALEKAGGWSDLETEDGTVSLDLRQVVFVRSAAAHPSIGFGQG
jgi:phosphosulfolactate synthase (CoM biosynthesis protein A)